MKKKEKHVIPVLKDEKWWGGPIQYGFKMPWTTGSMVELRGQNHNNQASPLLLSSAGNWIWSENAFKFSLSKRHLHVEGSNFFFGHAPSLSDAFLEASHRFFPASNSIPDPLLFSAPQYNTWIELLYNQTQSGVLKYARGLIRNGFPPGVLMIDEGWAQPYGDWTFNPTRFPDPKRMIEELHNLGFKVMLWVVPYLSPDSREFRNLLSTRALLRAADGEPAIRKWWNGYSAVLDLTGPDGVAFLRRQLDALIRQFGVDGFKFDGGDSTAYRDDDLSFAKVSANAQTEAYARFGLGYRLNEFRAGWKCSGQALAQRLADKAHSWDDDGIKSVIPNMLAQGLMGYSFGCPDMIGGGEYQNFLRHQDNIDAELFVRYAQISALMPMMQFSAAPWRFLDAKHLKLCRDAALLHHSLRKTFVSLAKESALTGEPIVRHLAYSFPRAGLEYISDQFMLSNQILVAPVIRKGAKQRRVVLPPGEWRCDQGRIYHGPMTATISTPLSRLPRFTRL